MKTEVYNEAHNESTRLIIDQLPDLDGMTVMAVCAHIDSARKRGAWCVGIADRDNTIASYGNLHGTALYDDAHLEIHN